METLFTHRPIHPSPLSQSIEREEDPDFSNQRHSHHPTFQQILNEVSLENQGQNSVLNFHEFKDSGNSPTDRSSRKKHVTDTREPSLAMSGAILTSSDILMSTLMDGPYQQTHSKAAKLLSSLNQTKNSSTNSLDNLRRFPNAPQNHTAYKERSVRSSSQSDYGISPSRVITRPSSPQTSTRSLFNEGRYGRRPKTNTNQASHSRSVSSLTQSRSEPSSPQLKGRSQPSSPHLSPINSQFSRPGSPKVFTQSKSNSGQSSRPGSPKNGRDSLHNTYSHSSASTSARFNPASHTQQSSSNSRSSRSSQHPSPSSRNTLNIKSRSTPTSPQLLPSSSRTTHTLPSNRTTPLTTRKIVSGSSYSHESLIQSTSKRNQLDKESAPLKTTHNKDNIGRYNFPESFETTRSSSVPAKLLAFESEDQLSQRRGSQSSIMDICSLQKTNTSATQTNSARTSKTFASSTTKKPQECFEPSTNLTSTSNHFENKPAVDWSFIENVDAKLAYNHLTKEARLVYFEDGCYPKKKLLPKGRLIPPSQLTLDRETANQTKRYLSPRKPNFEILNATPSARPTLPKKSPDRKHTTITTPKVKSPTEDSLSQGLKGLLDSTFWSKDSTLSETRKTPTPTPTLTPASPGNSEESTSSNRLNKTLSIIDLLSKASGTKIASLSQTDAKQTSTVCMDSLDDAVNEKAWALSADPKSLPGALRRRPSSAFDKRVRVAPEPTVMASVANKPQLWLSQFRQQDDNLAMFVTGKTSCAILCGSLYKLGGNRQWQKRQFRADGFLLVCLSKERIKNSSSTIFMEQPDYLTEDWRSYCHPTTPPAPHITHPLVASPNSDNPNILDYHQAPKWVIPIGDIVEVSLLTRKGVRVPDSFVIHTRSRNYILKAINPHELASWIYMLQRMIVTYQECRALMPGFTPNSLSRSTSVDESFQLSSKDLGLRFKPVSTHPRSREKDSSKSNSSSQKTSSQNNQLSSGAHSQRTDSTRLLQQQGRRASSLFHTHQPGSKPDSSLLSEHQLNREIAHDWIGGLASLSYCKRST